MPVHVHEPIWNIDTFYLILYTLNTDIINRYYIDGFNSFKPECIIKVVKEEKNLRLHQR